MRVTAATVAWLGLSCLFDCAEASAAEFDIPITQTPIEDLLNMKVTSVSRRSEPISEAPAAVYVLTAADIKRSGATSIPEALRLVPGVQTARIDANKWAVSVRGFNSRTANKLLVLVDGRSIYDLLFTGVLWETKDVLLEDVERIEVIRGPGGTLWGANAVNGVINIITRNAAETRGGLVTAAAGTEIAFINLRYGRELAEGHNLRVYGKFSDRDAGHLPQREPDDDAQLFQAGFRYDGTLTGRDTLTIQGDLYDGEQGTADADIRPDTMTSGANLLARWTRVLDPNSSISLQAYYDRTELENPVLGEGRNVYAVEFQHQLAPRGRHHFIWGADLRHTSDDIDNTPELGLDPDSRTTDLLGAFVQDEIVLTDDLSLTLGAKLESNDYTGTEVMPNARLAWRLGASDIVWAAVSRAVRTPSRLEQDFVVPLPGGATFAGNGRTDAEVLVAYEAGYRFTPTPDVKIDLAAFFNDYDNLVTTEGLTLGNEASADTHGFELATTYVPSDDWKFVLGYSYLQLDLDLSSASMEDPAEIRTIEGSDPEQQAFFRISANPFARTTLDFTVRYVDALPAHDISSYTVADLSFSRQLGSNAEVWLVGQNLFDRHHLEQRTALATEVERSVYAKFIFRY